MSFNTILIVTLMSLQFILSANGQGTETKITEYCEFDLVDELGSSILDLLPPVCKTVDPVLRQAMKDEATQFAEFMSILAEKEEWEEQGRNESRTTLDLDVKLREKVYNSTLGNCTATTETSLDYIGCRIEYRQDLISKFNEPDPE